MSGKVVLVVREGDLSEALALLKSIYSGDIEVYALRKSKRIDTRTYLTPGKLEELKNRLNGAEVERVYVYDVLQPRQVINLMRELRAEVYDKVGLILDIFSVHAGSKEAKLQIEAARITHQLPLIREWVRRSKLRELPGFLGPGTYAIDTYYRHMKRRLARIKRELEELRKRRASERLRRARYGWPQVAIAGYANAGKTTLFNVLAGESKEVGPEMFTTISPKAKATLIKDRKVALVDTVGFIRDTPPEVIEAFYATLEEISEASLTLLVIDASEDEGEVLSKLRASLTTLENIGYQGRPLIIVLNKIDLIDDVSRVSDLVRAVEGVMQGRHLWEHTLIPASALRRINLDLIKEAIYTYVLRQEGVRTEVRAQT